MKTAHETPRLFARPFSVLAVLFTVSILSNAAIVGCGGSSQQTGSQGESTPSTGMPPEGSGSMASAADVGVKIYAEKCAMCHGAEGRGDGPAAAGLNPRPRDHTDGAYMNARSDDELTNLIRHGKGAMPPWGAVLSDEEIKAVLAHVRSLADPPYGASH